MFMSGNIGETDLHVFFWRILEDRSNHKKGSVSDVPSRVQSVKQLLSKQKQKVSILKYS